MLCVSEKVVKQVLDPTTAITASRNAFIGLFKGLAEIPERTIFPVCQYGNSLFKPGLLVGKKEEESTLGLKVVHVRNGNASLPEPLPTVPATISLFDAKTGQQTCLMGATFLTAMRTAAGSAVATEIMSKKDSKTLMIFGAGLQANCHAQTICCVREICTLVICNRSRPRGEALMKDLKKEMNNFDLEIVLVDSSAQEIVNEWLGKSDIVCTTTASPKPLFDGSKLKEGCHINAVGSYSLNTSELDFETIKRAAVVVDTEEALSVGDLQMPFEAKVTSKEETVLGTLGTLICSEDDVLGKFPAKDITMFKSVGTAAQDLATASAVYENCSATNAGLRFDLEE